MKNNTKVVTKQLRDKILLEIVLQYRDNQKKTGYNENVRLFEIFLESKDLTYSEFIDIILSLEAQGYIHYKPERKDKYIIPIRGELIAQEFVTLNPSAKSFPETLDMKTKRKSKQI